MGLAGPKNKQKLSHDPNNTKWTRDTTSFGHRMMTSQGWTPGQYLGAQDAPHAEYHTAANASHIRVVLKDNTLGLGAKSGSGLGEGECTGLDVFQTLLGRLNGNEDEVQREIKNKEDLKRAIYTERKWGSIRFVKGGVLFGDKIQDLIDGEKERLKLLVKDKVEDGDTSESSDESSDEEEAAEEKKKSKSKSSNDMTRDESDRKSKAKNKRKSDEISGDEAADSESNSKSKKKKKQSEDPERIARKAARAAKRAAKAERREKKAASEGEEGSKSKKDKKDRKRKDKGVTSISLPTSNMSTPGASTPTSQPGTPNSMLGGRHAVRSRNILQKRMAVMDPASLNQIFMIKS